MADLVKTVLGQIRDVVVCIVVGVVDRHSDDLFVLAVVVDHVEHADGLALYQSHGQNGLAAQDKNVERVAVVGICTRNKAVVCGIVGRGKEHAVKLEHTGLLVELVFIFSALGYFDY